MDKDAAFTELTLSTLEAFDYGNQGRVASGYLILTSGLVRARGGQEESAQLVELWERAMAQFRQRFPSEGYLDT
jgi:hypothetical protein